MEEELKELSITHEEYVKKEAELERWEREHPTWDVDNISKESKSRSIINGYAKKEEPKKPEVRRRPRRQGRRLGRVAGGPGMRVASPFSPPTGARRLPRAPSLSRTRWRT